MSLVTRHPLVSIKTDAQLAAASMIVDELLRKRKLRPGEEAYLEALGDLIARYEDEHWSIPAATNAELLAHLLEAKGLTQAELSRDTGISRSTVSEILSGRRSFSKSQIAKLAVYFHVEPGAFLRSS